MPEVPELPLEYVAFLALHSLSAAEQQRVRDRLVELAATPMEQWEQVGLHWYQGDPPLGMISVDESLRIMVDLTAESTPTVVEIVRQERLDAFRRSMVNQGGR